MATDLDKVTKNIQAIASQSARIACGITPSADRVVLDLGTERRCLVMDRAQALRLAEIIRQSAEKLHGADAPLVPAVPTGNEYGVGGFGGSVVRAELGNPKLARALVETGVKLFGPQISNAVQ